jgi:hypothetical protein
MEFLFGLDSSLSLSSLPSSSPISTLNHFFERGSEKGIAFSHSLRILNFGQEGKNSFYRN